MPSKSLKLENDELKAEICALNNRIYHYNVLLTSKTAREKRYNFEYHTVDSFKEITRFEKSVEPLWFLTLNYDPEFLTFNNETQEYEFYESSIIKVLWDEDTAIPIELHGTFEHCPKSGKLHVHMIVKCYRIEWYVANIKSYMTHRRHLPYSVVNKPVKDLNGLYDDYFVKQNLSKFVFKS